MAVSMAHPRRRSPQKDAAPPANPSPQNTHTASAMSLHKSDTFNGRIRVSNTLITPFEAADLIPKRSETNPKTLEQLLVEGENHVDYVSKLLSDFNLSWKSTNATLPVDAGILADPQVLAVPTVSQPIDIAHSKQATASREHHHDSDSGLGTSVDSAVTEKDLVDRFVAPHISSMVTPRTTHFFTKESVRHIKKHIIHPILREPTLKEFHPLIEDIPRRIGAKFITNLRDLEKTLFFLAPDYASSPAKFLHFCETSIECLQTTVDLISERDQRKSTDRPYTNNYFVDLVDQIRRYAEIMRITREKQERGEDLDDMDYASDEEIAIQGGLSENGRPAELIRNKNGKAIALSNNTILEDIDEGTSSKRPFTDLDMDDDEIYRSMARRRKSEKPSDVMHGCRVCDKEFKRPCDLTKHEKTHSRPWKCPDTKCKYNEMGWPTEKERDRHMNDKHSVAPMMYKCRFPPCTYSSKRESNCKQHMEKAHGWNYTRSKHNGRNKASTTGLSASPITPLTPFIPTPAMNNVHLVTPQTMFAPSPILAVGNTPFDGDAGVWNFNHFPPTPSNDGSSMLHGRRESVATAASAGTYVSDLFSPPNVPSSTFEEAMDFDSTLPLDLLQPTTNPGTTFQYQQPTPAMSVSNNFGVDFVDFSKASPVHTFADVIFSNSTNNNTDAGDGKHLSPLTFGDPTLYSPESAGSFNDSHNFDEALGAAGGGSTEFDFGGGGDFQLYNSPAPGEAGPSNYHAQHLNHANESFTDYSSAGAVNDLYLDWGFPDTKDVIALQFDEAGNYIGDAF